MQVPAPAIYKGQGQNGRTSYLVTRLLCAFWLLCCAFVTPPAWADDYAEVSRLIQAGRLVEASRRIEQHLSDKPRDPQMRFLQGVIYNESGRPAQAEGIFTRLTQEYPELPEPYNNLAVIQAAKGELDQARQSLEAAVKLDPGYATAHENLGDIYAQLAGRSYAKAQQLERNRPQIAQKLSMVRQLATLNPPTRLSPAPSNPAASK